VVGHYESFFITSAGASAAILGLLVVAVWSRVKGRWPRASALCYYRRIVMRESEFACMTPVIVSGI
jgi:hypothetical protein